MSDQHSQPPVVRWSLSLLVAASVVFYIVLNWSAVAVPLRALWQAWSG
jgi:hypothetical protein